MLGRMTHHMRHNTVAYLALFFALTGSAVAAAPLMTGAKIENGTINSDDLRDRGSAAYPGPSIQGKDVEANTLGGDEILESGLGKVGDADTLDGKNSTDFLGASAKAADADKLDGKNSTEFATFGGTVDASGVLREDIFSRRGTFSVEKAVGIGVYYIKLPAGTYANCKFPTVVVSPRQSGIVATVGTHGCNADGSSTTLVQTSVAATWEAKDASFSFIGF